MTVQVTSETVQAEMWDFGNPRRVLACPMGCEYSAHAGDYFMRVSNAPFTCEHDGEEYVCALVEQRHIQGHDAQGREYAGTVWVVVNESPTPSEL